MSDDGSALCGNIMYDHLLLRPLQVLGIRTDNMPQLSVPLPAELQEPQHLCFTHLDGDTRIARSSDGFIYCFSKGIQSRETAAA